MTILWSRKHPEQPNDAEPSSMMYQVPSAALSALSIPWSGNTTPGKIAQLASSLNANQATPPGSKPPNGHPLADHQHLFLECVHSMLLNPEQTPPGILSVFITTQASFLKKASLIGKQQQQSTTNNGREPLILDDISVLSSARTDPGPRMPKQHRDANSVASAPAKLTTNIVHPSVESVISADDWDTDRIDPSVVEAQQDIINRQGQQILELAAQQQENQETIGQLAAQQQENQKIIGQLQTEQQASQNIMDQQQTELLEKLEAAHAQQVHRVQKHNEYVATLHSKRDDMMALIEAQHAGLQERDSLLLLQDKKIAHVERGVKIALEKRSEAIATSPKNPGDNKDNEDNSESEDEEGMLQRISRPAKHKHNNRKKKRNGKKPSKHKDENTGSTTGSTTTAPTTNQEDVPKVYDWDFDFRGFPMEEVRKGLHPP
jgi:hypothetical protein